VEPPADDWRSRQKRGREAPVDDFPGGPPVPGTEQPVRWRVAVSMTVFEGYAFLTEAQALALQDELSKRKDVLGNVFLRATQLQQPTDYTDVESVLKDIELAVPVSRDER
jgi:hypothetical protein